MNDVYAAWAAAHAPHLFIALPLLTGAAALFFVRGYLALSATGRAALFATATCASFMLFLLLAMAVERRGTVVAFDGALANALSMSMSTSLLWLLSWFTYLGDRNLLTVLSVLMTLYLLWRGQWPLALFCAIATGMGGALNWLLKHAFERVRPEHDHGYASVAGWSFPSGHSSAAMAVYGTACYLTWRLAPPAWRMPCVAVMAALIMAIGLSRILLQVHFASDVAAGLAVSLGWLALCIAVVERLRPSGGVAQRMQ
ncbi:phosphatase PAP2 family protein [Achromobacter deleyi]|uniref:phosphatase PAP2 family protein n=1 Tax=Achromobacter deleyi TaxID=1353891 RepID=UPI001492419F|nr:phosphatase PAP2 family protein [Achromobacter deleyi]QVQ24349.1 phosphatase PAP2 family protein [Achromobacter deleyi]UIP19878.1 phosphatase PAP2 family protein [Achromobacter deleyi]